MKGIEIFIVRWYFFFGTPEKWSFPNSLIGGIATRRKLANFLLSTRKNDRIGACRCAFVLLTYLWHVLGVSFAGDGLASASSLQRIQRTCFFSALFPDFA
nr:MAG TPA: hypothetical protein [Herelleviridae sp.]